MRRRLFSPKTLSAGVFVPARGLFRVRVRLVQARCAYTNRFRMKSTRANVIMMRRFALRFRHAPTHPRAAAEIIRHYAWRVIITTLGVIVCSLCHHQVYPDVHILSAGRKTIQTLTIWFFSWSPRCHASNKSSRLQRRFNEDTPMEGCFGRWLCRLWRICIYYFKDVRSYRCRLWGVYWF